MSAPADIAIVVPAYNEEAALPNVLDAIPRQGVAAIIVADNGSTDATAAVARARGAIVVAEPRRGYGAACLAGLAALPERAAIVVFLDADFSDFPEDLPRLVEPIRRDEADLVIGTRIHGEQGRDVLAPQAYWGNRLAVGLIRLIWGRRYSDLGPFRAIRRDALESLGMRDRTWGWTVEMQVRAIERGLRVLEVPVRYRKRIGESKISGTVSGTVRAGWKILWTIGWRAIAGRSRPSSGRGP